MLSELKIKKAVHAALVLLCVFLYASCTGGSKEKKTEELQKAFFSCDCNKINKIFKDGIKISPAVQKDLLRISLEINSDSKPAFMLADYLGEIDAVYNSKTILYWVLKLEDYEAAKTLILKGADLFSANNNDELDTPFTLALEKRNSDFVEWIVKDFLVSTEQESGTIYKVFSDLIYHDYLETAQFFMHDQILEPKLMSSPNLLGLIVFKFYDKDCKNIIEDLKNRDLIIDYDYPYYHDALFFMNNDDISLLVEWLKSKGVDGRKKYHFTDHPCTNGNEYTTPSEFAELLADFSLKTMTDNDEPDYEMAANYRKWSEYFENFKFD